MLCTGAYAEAGHYFGLAALLGAFAVARLVGMGTVRFLEVTMQNESLLLTFFPFAMMVITVA